MDFLRKYLLFLLLIANLTAEYILFMSVSKYLFYTVLCLSIIFFLSKDFYSITTVKMCSHIFILIGILVLYQLLFIFNLSNDSLLYFAGKLSTLGIMMICIKHNFEFYLKKFILPFSYIILLLIIVGYFLNQSIAGHMTFGFMNRNAACALASIGFAGFLFVKDSYKAIDYICMSILFITILIGGSRNSLVMCLIFIVLRYGLSVRLTIIMLCLIAIIIFILPQMGIEVEAFDRLVNTVTGDLATDRENQRRGALMMIQEKPWTGWGLASQIQGKALSISHYGAHNGYLTLLMYMGYPLGIVFISIIIGGVIKRFFYYRIKDRILNYHLAVLISVLFAANQEDFLVGVNQIITNLFFVSFVITGMYIYYYKNNYIIYSDETELKQ